MRAFFIILLIIIVIIITAVFIYRYQIFQYSAESIIRNLLPDYIRIDKINFDLKNSKVVLADFKILNPEGFSDRYFLEIKDITCKYRMKGRNIIDGIEILDPSFTRPTLNIERLRDGRLNLVEMQKYLEGPQKPKAPSQSEPKKETSPVAVVGNKTLPDIVKLPEKFTVRDGTVIFTDRLPYTRPHLITFENVNGSLSLALDDKYSKILSLSSTGEGNVSGNKRETIRWTVSLVPTTPKLTMSNRFEVSNVDILTLEPYYDKYSPFVFRKGRFSGTLIFDFDNGNIGSTNEIHLTDIQFYIKRGHENAAFWETNVQDLAKYFTTSFGEIVFDFKIKGDMSEPKFYLGPISKQALTSMAVDKISDVIQEVTKAKSGGAAPAPSSDAEKVGQYIELFKGLMKK